MRVPRVRVRSPIEGRAVLVLDDAAAHHVHRVLRLRPGNALVLFDGQGGEYTATVTDAGASGVTVQVEAFRDVDRTLDAVRVTLWQAVCRGGRMDNALEKATELGVHRIVPLLSQRVVVKLTGARGESRREHWQRVVEAACEQCGTNRVPEVTSPVSLGDALRRTPAHAGDAGSNHAVRWRLDPRARRHLAQAYADLPPQPARVILAVGPEGGFESEEEAMLEANGFTAVHLGPRVLRADTAGPAALAVLGALTQIAGTTEAAADAPRGGAAEDASGGRS